jgi:hypothetical protein
MFPVVSMSCIKVVLLQQQPAAPNWLEVMPLILLG